MATDPALLKVALWAELKNGNVHEADVRDKRFHLDGLCEGGKVYVNPAPSIVETLIHELCHRRYPKWSEKRVLIESRRVLSKMSETEVRKWYREFSRVAKKRSRPVRVED